ncbi:MAG: alkaline phosphatase family protein [Azospirillum sp.]|nr:alkaline phosphatase family protein [Azospirillum sp.]
MISDLDRSPEPVGPVLFFRGMQGSRWRVSALFVLSGATEPEDLRVDGVSLAVPPRHLFEWQGRHVWRFDFAVPRGRDDSTAGYGFGDRRPWRFHVPGAGRLPRLAFTACNGAEDLDMLARLPAGRNERWVDLAGCHAKHPFHLLLQGGDQIYADGVWQACPGLAAWQRLPRGQRCRSGFDDALAEQVMAYYFDLYVATWGQPELAAVLSSIPSVMMWDDHDIFDGWGSHPPPLQDCPVFSGIHAVARRQFSLFQLASAGREPPECIWGAKLGSFTQGFRLGEIGIFAPDLRSERSPTRVLGPGSWRALPGWLERFAGCRHLLLMSSVPMAFVDLGAVEGLLNALPWRNRLEDDLRDQWRSPAHRVEWLRLVRLLGDFSKRTGCRITAVSGEIHLGMAGRLRGPGFELDQLVSSGVVHPPPSTGYAAALGWLGRGRSRPGGDCSVEILPLGGGQGRFLRARNWLDLAFETDGRLAARWHVEGLATPLTTPW